MSLPGITSLKEPQPAFLPDDKVVPLAQVEKLMLLQTGEKQEHGHILGLLARSMPVIDSRPGSTGSTPKASIRPPSRSNRKHSL